MENEERVRELMREGHPEPSARLIATLGTENTELKTKNTELKTKNAELNGALVMLRLVKYAMWERERHDPGGRNAARQMLHDTFGCITIKNGRYEIPEDVAQNGQ